MNIQRLVLVLIAGFGYFLALAIGLFVFFDTPAVVDDSSCTVSTTSSDQYRADCEQIQKGTPVVDAIVGLGFVFSNSCKSDHCTVVLEGRTGLFCDQCIVTYSPFDGLVTDAQWLYGDQ